jgi:RNA polymerase sigma-70 factor, ECF subfamily
MAMMLEERSLIKRAVDRDSEAFAALYVLYYESVLRKVSPLVKSRQEAEDVTSEAFLRAWNAIDRFEDRGVPILAWLTTIAQNVALKQQKTRRPNLSLDDLTWLPDGLESPEDSAVRQSRASLIRDSIGKLPKAQREVVSLRFLGHLSYDEVGIAVNKSTGTVRVLQHRALRALRNVLAGQGI